MYKRILISQLLICLLITPAALLALDGSSGVNILESEQLTPSPTETVSTPTNPSTKKKPDSTDTSSGKNMGITEMMLFNEEIIISTATKRLQKLSEVPGSVTIILEKDIAERGALNLLELLRGLVGTDMSYDTIVYSVFFRGIPNQYNNKILVLIDGRKINYTDIGDYYFQYGLNINDIKQIEIIRGPGSALYGSNAFSGVINIITKDGKDLHGLKTRNMLGYNRYNQMSQYYMLTYGDKTNDMDYKVGASYWRLLSEDPVNWDVPNNAYEGQEIHFALKSGERLVLRAGYQKEEFPEIGTSLSPTPNNHNIDDYLYADVTYNWRLNDISSLSVRLGDTFYLLRGTKQLDYIFKPKKINSLRDVPHGVSTVYDDAGGMFPISESVGGYYITVLALDQMANNRYVEKEGLTNNGSMNELVAETQYDFSWPENNYFIAGIGAQLNWSARDMYQSDDVSDSTIAFYLQDEYQFTDRFIALVGSRYDFHSEYGGNLTPRTSLIYSPLNGLRLKLLYGTSFRFPNLAERNAQYQYVYLPVVGKSDLKPEKIQQVEAGAEYEYGKWLQAKGGVFYWETENETSINVNPIALYVYSPDMSLINAAFPAAPGFYSTNQLQQISYEVYFSNKESHIGRGFELESTLRPLDYIQLKFNYTRLSLYAKGAVEVAFMGAQSFTWVNGNENLFGGQFSFNYQNMFYANFYANVVEKPVSLYLSPDPKIKWFKEFDLSIGSRYEGIGLNLTVLNLFENSVYYDHYADDYLKTSRIYRLIVDYIFTF